MHGEASNEKPAKMTRSVHPAASAGNGNQVLHALENLAAKMKWPISSEDLELLIAHPESYTPAIVFPMKPSSPLASSTSTPFGFSMQFWLDLCRISGEYKIDKDNLEYTIMLYPPPSKEC